MEKLKMKTKNKVNINIDSIGRLFPNTVTETIKGHDENNKLIIEKAIDFDILKQELSKFIVEGREERYQMNWPGKKEAILRANSSINKTLRPCKKESVDFDKTKNLYIEGDNLEVLKLLQETYLNKVKMIYIDPPYNTGNDSFVYPDNFTMSSDEFSEVSGQYDEDGNINYDIRKNSESNGKFHTDWLNMMYPRLKLAKDLLSDDGVIFISIDDNEVDNLKKICNEIYGEGNFVSCFTWIKKKKGSHLSKTVRNMTEYILCYSKYINNIELFGEDAYSDKWQPLAKRTNSQKVLEIPPNKVETKLVDGVYNSGRYGNGTSSLNFITNFKVSNGIIITEFKVEGPFVWTQNKLKEELKLGTRIALSTKYGFNVLRSNQKEKVKRPTTILNSKLGIGTNEDAYSESMELFGKEAIMSYPKPITLIKYLINTLGFYDDKMIILDFFSGSATTAHAVMQLNAENGGNRKFIMVQLPEETDKKSEAFKAGYKNICEIGKERIKRAGKKIKEENPDKADTLDIGFRVLKLDSSNMKDVYYNPNDYNQDMIEQLESNIKENRSSKDLLFQVMLDLGELLSSDIKEIQIEGKKVFNVGDGNIIACFDNDITNKVLSEIAKIQPLYAIFRDSSLSNDSVATNFEQIFKTYSPNTIRKVL
ncbi:site-specific DNA-methyltransferase [Clostridium taeniosporum]|uniref:Site-specific DNA-methyltransferase n=1 Tax=Clostridium taeniosporum TaxID=394958 RepID=A0A1D7XNZ1_9CLOT|nr:site-specific DNA-methyltransferase [Clostridium taeniosporum]AOR25055.1 site-specific DNA-methyltransferase [Clostridium taeniosporum]